MASEIQVQSRYFDRLGNPITGSEWARQFEEGNRVELTQVGRNEVSTVWLGLNHQWRDGPPLIFETMIFGPDFEDEYQERYSNIGEAREGHWRAVEYVKEYNRLHRRIRRWLVRQKPKPNSTPWPTAVTYGKVRGFVLFGWFLGVLFGFAADGAF